MCSEELEAEADVIFSCYLFDPFGQKAVPVNYELIHVIQGFFTPASAEPPYSPPPALKGIFIIQGCKVKFIFFTVFHDIINI